MRTFNLSDGSFYVDHGDKVSYTRFSFDDHVNKKNVVLRLELDPSRYIVFSDYKTMYEFAGILMEEADRIERKSEIDEAYHSNQSDIKKLRKENDELKERLSVVEDRIKVSKIKTMEGEIEAVSIDDE